MAYGSTSPIPERIKNNIALIKKLANERHAQNILERDEPAGLYGPPHVVLLNTALRLSLGRGQGHTLAIRTGAKPGDLVVVANIRMVQDLRANGLHDGVSTRVLTQEFRGIRERYSRVWVDMGGVRSQQELVNLYAAICHGAISADCLVLLGEHT